MTILYINRGQWREEDGRRGKWRRKKERGREGRGEKRGRERERHDSLVMV